MIRYFQLTPEILLEYIYDRDPKLNGGDKVSGIIGNIKDLKTNPTILLNSKAFGSKYMCFKNESEGLDSFSNLVLPLNNNETQFVVAKTKYQNFFSTLNALNRFSSNGNTGYIYEDGKYDSNIIGRGKSCKVKYDKCIIHFTSRNYFAGYDALIFQAYAYMNNKSKLYFASFLFRKTSNIDYKAEHMLYNEKLYTTQIEFDIPSVFSIINNDNLEFNKALKSQDIEILKNTPIGINVYGASDCIIGIDNYEKFKTRKLNSISIPYIYNRFDDISVDIYESNDGDYYIINPKMSSNYPSFVEYIESMGEDIRAYMIMHELCLKESWEYNGTRYSEITHKEHHIIDIHYDDEDEEISKKFDAEIKYRPICIHTGNGYSAIIIDTIKIINTVDSSSYEVVGSIDIKNPHKYGKSLKSINIRNDSRPIVNVYNKKVLDENGMNNAISLNRGGGFVVENKTQSITSFIECTNVGISIQELSADDLKKTNLNREDIYVLNQDHKNRKFYI